MFSYYGSKSKIVDYYPPPKHKKIIEPFAGSARYSLKYWQNDVLLLDKYPVIVNVWNYLKNASEEDILKLPRLTEGQNVDDFDLTEDEKILMGFIVQGATTGMRKTVSFRNSTNRPNFINHQIKSIAGNLYKVRHWEIKLGNYDELENIEATWFIDPPYQFGGEHYPMSNKSIDYIKLADWCKSRNGQVIVCENTKADWMEFKPITKMKGSIYSTTEAIWSNVKTNYDNEQILLQF